MDAVAAHLYRLSRGDVTELIRQGKVFIDDMPTAKSDQLLKPGQVLSVRGHGRARGRLEGPPRPGGPPEGGA